jgi:FixJ family two-component response regulator
MSFHTLFIVDDNAEFRESARWWLGGAGYEVQDFGAPEPALAALRQWSLQRPVPGADTAGEPPLACLLLDVRMPQMSGLDLHDKLNAEGISIPVVYMTGHGDVPLAVQAMERGAVTFLEKPFPDEALEGALAKAFERAREQRQRTLVQARDEAGVRAYRQRYGSLSQREREVLQGVMEGKINKSIARELGVSVKTVDLHRANLMDKMQAKSVVHLVRMVTTGCVQ